MTSGFPNEDEPCIVYKLSCLVTKKDYIGISRKTAAVRLQQHKKDARSGTKDTVLYRAMNKHGHENFVIEVLYEAVNAREAQMVERGLIAAHGTLAPMGMNTSTGGERWAGRAVTAEVRAKIRAAKLGTKQPRELVERLAAARRGKRKSATAIANHIAAMNRPEVREACVGALRAATAKRKEEGRSADAIRKLWTDPKFRQAHLVRLAALNERKRELAKMKPKGRTKREAMLARWQDPAYREKMGATIRIAGKSANARAARIASNKARKGVPHRTKRLPKTTLSVRAMVALLPAVIVPRRAA